jgi:hypothetical protein
MCDNLQHMIPAHRPTEIKNIVSTVRVMNLLAVAQNQAFTRGDTPNDGHIMLFTTASGTSLPIVKGFGVSKTKPPDE